MRVLFICVFVCDEGLYKYDFFIFSGFALSPGISHSLVTEKFSPQPAQPSQPRPGPGGQIPYIYFFQTQVGGEGGGCFVPLTAHLACQC